MGLLCRFIALRFGLFEFEHGQKWIIVAAAFLGSTIAGGISAMTR